MTDGNPDGTQAGPLDIQWSFGLVKRPDGKHWILISIATMMNNYQFNIPPDNARQLASQLPKLLMELAKDAEAQDSGLVVAAQIPKSAPPDFLKKGLR